jgi:flagellum-specific peptidoglycan hydrolase FlgJ
MKIQFLNKSITFTLFFVFLFGILPTKAQQAAYDYIEKHKEKALVLKRQSGIPASIILGVSFVESAMGRSRNCKLLNNYFGIKGKNNLAKIKGGPRSAYKQYPNSMASFKDFVRIVKAKKYYSNLKGNKDYRLWLKKMNQHGYAEAKGKWIGDITSVIEKYNLEEIDNEVLIFDDDSFPIWGTDTTMMLELGE